MAPAGTVNVGQLVRERHGAEGVVPVGFGSYAGLHPENAAGARLGGEGR